MLSPLGAGDLRIFPGSRWILHLPLSTFGATPANSHNEALSPTRWRDPGFSLSGRDLGGPPGKVSGSFPVSSRIRRDAPPERGILQMGAVRVVCELCTIKLI